ncbi:MAG: hypothetical protein WA829_08100, partial [Candidatus Acidiferrum sp.]
MRSQFAGAVGAEFVGFDYFMFAVGAAGMQVTFTVGAEVEAGADGFSALRARIGQWLAHQKIDDEADEAPRGQQ